MPRRIPNPVSMLLPSLSCLCFLTRLDISDCNLQTIPNDCGYLYSLEVLNLSGNNFDCLPESIIQLSKLKNIFLMHCTRLRSLPQLPSSTSVVVAENCTSLETLPNRSTQDKLYPPSLILYNCFKLADIQHRSNVFFRMLSADAQVSLSLSLSLYIYIYIYIIKGKLYKGLVNHSFWESFYGKLKKLSKQ